MSDRTYSLFLDDERFPPDDGRDWKIARSYDEAIQIVTDHGWPAHISFDHDLGDGVPTGYDLAKWLVDADLDGIGVFDGLTWAIHSQNPVGAANITGLFESYLQSRAS